MNNEIIIYGGAFNPPTIAHMAVGQAILNKFKDKKLVYLPTNDYYNKDLLAPFSDRINMLNLMIKKMDGNVSVSDYEEEDKEYKGTYYTLKHFNHPYFVMGADSLDKLPSWINSKKLIEENHFIVFPREGYNIEEILKKDILKENIDHFIIIDDFLKNNISSSEFRYHKNKDVLIKEIKDYIEEKGLYR